MKIYQNYINILYEFSKSNSEKRFAANKLLKLHSDALNRANPLIIELGVDKGQSTRVFLNAIDNKPDAKLISIDIEDCSSSVRSDRWEFVQQDSLAIDSLLSKKPIIKNGIDLLYVDSKHTDEHVKKEVYNFFKYIKKDGAIYFDDIDSNPYMIGQRKDSINEEIANRKILKLIEAIFRANYESVDLSILRGSTGLAKLTKKSLLGDVLNPPKFILERNYEFFWKCINLLMFKRGYRHNNYTDESFLISPNIDEDK